MNDHQEQYDLSQYNKRHLLTRFFHECLRPNLKTYIPVQLLHIVGALLGLVPPLLLRRLIDQAIPAQQLSAILNLSLWALGAFTAIAAIRFLRNYLGHKVAQKIVFDMRNKIYKHFQFLPMEFHDNRKTGELMSRVIDDLNILQEFVHHGPEGVLTATTNIIGVVVILFVFNVPLTLLALSFTPLLGIFSYKLIQKMHKAFRRNRAAKGKLNDRLEDNLAGIKVIKAFANEDFEMDRFSSRNRDHFDARASAITYFSTLGPVSFFFNSLGLVLTLGYGGYLVSAGNLSAGTIVAFYTYLVRFRAPILLLVQISQRLSRFFASMERYFSHLDIEPTILKSAGPYKKEDRIDGRIELAGVHFSYENTDHVLKDINIQVPPQHTVALVGPSGSGKTSIVRLIPRLYDATRGEVKVDDVNVKEWDLWNLRKSISMVMQDDYLFSGTIAENIAYGDPRSSMDRIKKFARQANVHEFVQRMPDGYQTDIGQRGVKLSGGQRQRISIARALLQDPEILILDEATSSVDSYTEKLIQQAIDKVTQGRTTLIIAHRLSTITNADEILFIEQGQIKERGTYKELMEKKDRFFQFYKLQFQKPTIKN